MAFILVTAVILALIWPKEYKAITRFAPAFYVQTPFSELRSAGVPDLSALITGGVLISDVYVGIMKSRTVMEDVIVKCNLLRVFRRKLMEDAIDDLKRNSSLDIGLEEIITLTVFMPDPKLAAHVANTWVNSLDSLNQWVTKLQGSRESAFISSRLDDMRKKSDSLRDSLSSFESRYRIFSLDDEMRATVEVYANLARQLMQKEVELSKWERFAEGAPIRRSIETEIESIRKKLSDLETNWHSSIVTKVPISRLPLLQYEHTNLLRTKRTLDSLSSYLLLEYEIARLKSSVNTPTVYVIDEAIPPEKRIWPSRVKIVLLSFLFGLFFNMVLVLAVENVKIKWKL
ncbi:MAG: hypothetical protein OEV79_11160 [candidate division WOR-3 bacterium]|nr:hypothetical protein [candidate division WOR-3 bacterium]